MGSCVASPAVLKAWLSWLKSGVVLTIGLPAALLALHLEIYGSSPRTTSRILYRLQRRLRLSSLSCEFRRRNEATGSSTSIFSVRGADVMNRDRAQSKRKPKSLSRKRSMTLDVKDQTTTQSSLGGPSNPLPPSQPQPQPLLLSQSENTFPPPPTSPTLLNEATHDPSSPSTSASLPPAPSSPTYSTFSATSTACTISQPQIHPEPTLPSPYNEAYNPPSFSSHSSSSSTSSSTFSISISDTNDLKFSPRPSTPPTPFSEASTYKASPCTISIASSISQPPFSPLDILKQASKAAPCKIAIASTFSLPPSAPVSPPIEVYTATLSTVSIASALSQPPSEKPKPLLEAFKEPPKEAQLTITPAATAQTSHSPTLVQARPALPALLPFKEASEAVSPSNVDRPQASPPTPKPIEEALPVQTKPSRVHPVRPALAPLQEPIDVPSIPASPDTVTESAPNATSTSTAKPEPSAPTKVPASSTPQVPFTPARPGRAVRSSEPSTPFEPTTPFPPFTPLPIQHKIANDSTPTPSSPLTGSALSHSSSRPKMPAHGRSMSHADIASKQRKRLSLQFPIQLAAGSSSPGFSPRSRPQSWVAAPSPLATPDPAPSPTESNILAVLAAQERYVLELKEELSKAESDLKMLKKHYATHESIKQRNELRKVTQLQPLNTTLVNVSSEQDDEDGSTAWMQKEMERRKAMLSGVKTSQRKVFSGSRHLRTLSLLSPDKTYSPSFPQPADVRNSIDETLSTSSNEAPKRPQMLTRHATSPDIANHIANTMDDDRYDLGGLPTIQRDALLRTGKKMAFDFKDGLLTFIEDIRQATVGDEAADDDNFAATPSAKGPSAKQRKGSETRPSLNRAASSKKSSSSHKANDIGDDFWKEHGLSEPKTASTDKKTHALKNTRTPQKNVASNEEFDEWDSWDTPNDKTATGPANEVESTGSSDESEEPSSPISSSRTSTRYHSKRHDSKASSLTSGSSTGTVDDVPPRDSKRNSIPWPDLVKMSPSNLKRTASHLMKEWEKTLTPPPESRDSSHSSGDYVGRSATPVDLL